VWPWLVGRTCGLSCDQRPHRPCGLVGAVRSTRSPPVTDSEVPCDVFLRHPARVCTSSPDAHGAYPRGEPVKVSVDSDAGLAEPTGPQE